MIKEAIRPNVILEIQILKIFLCKNINGVMKIIVIKQTTAVAKLTRNPSTILIPIKNPKTFFTILFLEYINKIKNKNKKATSNK